MLKGIIFDMDGVLINSEPFHYRVWKETLRQRGVNLEYQVYKACIGSTVGFLMGLLHEHYGIDAQEHADAYAAERGVCDAAADECEAARHNVCADKSAYNACQHRTDERVLEKAVFKNVHRL